MEVKNKEFIIVETKGGGRDCDQCYFHENCSFEICTLNIGFHYELK